MRSPQRSRNIRRMTDAHGEAAVVYNAGQIAGAKDSYRAG